MEEECQKILGATCQARLQKETKHYRQRSEMSQRGKKERREVACSSYRRGKRSKHSTGETDSRSFGFIENRHSPL